MYLGGHVKPANVREERVEATGRTAGKGRLGW
jgi:hypothetical protein